MDMDQTYDILTEKINKFLTKSYSLYWLLEESKGYFYVLKIFFKKINIFFTLN